MGQRKSPISFEVQHIYNRDSLASRTRHRVEGILEEFLSDEKRSFLSIHQGAAPLFEEVERMVFSGGKRLRPVICVLGHLACFGRGDQQIHRAAASLELLHTFALIQDDLMDAAVERRGQPTIHHRGGMHLSAESVADPVAAGRNVALLASDLAFVLSDQLFWSSEFDPDLLRAASIPLFRMRAEAIAGQYLDVTRTASEVTTNEARRIARLKTASYTVKGPLLVGATLARASTEQLQTLARFGEMLGEAFQMLDDIADLHGEEQATGPSYPNAMRAAGEDPLPATIEAARELVEGAAKVFEAERDSFVVAPLEALLAIGASFLDQSR